MYLTVMELTHPGRMCSLSVLHVAVCSHITIPWDGAGGFARFMVLRLAAVLEVSDHLPGFKRGK